MSATERAWLRYTFRNVGSRMLCTLWNRYRTLARKSLAGVCDVLFVFFPFFPLPWSACMSLFHA